MLGLICMLADERKQKIEEAYENYKKGKIQILKKHKHRKGCGNQRVLEYLQNPEVQKRHERFHTDPDSIVIKGHQPRKKRGIQDKENSIDLQDADIEVYEQVLNISTQERIAAIEQAKEEAYQDAKRALKYVRRVESSLES